MIDEMVTVLGEEQNSDDEKKEYCAAEFDKADDTKKALERAIGKLEKAIEENKSAIATLKEEIEDFTTNAAANSACIELIGVAKNRMNKFYNPKLYKAAPKRDLTEDERITSH